MNMEARLTRNLPTLSEAEQAILAAKRVLLVGCGGLGGYVLEYLLRLGVGEVTVMDGDRFEESNRNRQLLSAPALLGQSKAEAAAARAKRIAPEANCVALAEDLTPENAAARVRGMDLALDALDSVEARLLLEDACAAEGIPLVHGAVSGWGLQAAVSLPGSGLLHRLYEGQEGSGGSTLSFVPALCAAIECAEAAKLLCGRESSLAGKLLLADLQHMGSEIVEL